MIEELIQLAQDVIAAGQRDEELGHPEGESAAYGAFGANDSAVAVPGDEALCRIVGEIVKAVRNSVTIDWTLRENVRADIRQMVKRVLRKHGYLPDKQEEASPIVMEQTEVLFAAWVTQVCTRQLDS